MHDACETHRHTRTQRNKIVVLLGLAFGGQISIATPIPFALADESAPGLMRNLSQKTSVRRWLAGWHRARRSLVCTPVVRDFDLLSGHVALLMLFL